MKCLYSLYFQIGVLFLLASPISFAQQYATKVELDQPNSWSMILIPDIQNYSKYSQNQPILDLINRWIEANIDQLNIKIVLCTGDLVEQDDVILPGLNGNLSSKQQWEFIDKSFTILDHKIPYILATGNHDYTIDSKGTRTTQYDKYFPITKNYLNQKHLVQHGLNEHNLPTLTNAMYEFKGINNKDYLIVNLEYAPRNTTLNWANEILKFKQYENHQIVLLTHAYLNRNDTRLEGDNKWIIFEPYFKDKKERKSDRILLPESNNGEQIWNKIVKETKNMQLVLSGHISGEGYRVDKNNFGQEVHQMLFDMQSEGGGHQGNGGDGFIRILEFYDDNRTIKVKTFSPLFGISPKTAHLAHKRDERNQYLIHLD
ncbi:metallophosphoesterase [Myroides odoratimimus]|uniref:metallophosphoesterase n=1 Tax=Myroides odoratimimus TaxID=76832 RepID=UPI00257847E6|nr:metallophosphoesterase [Myroides odoratimimus]MDM1096595.1 metallophosphoesterase [Myroides odoratimimus]